MKPRAVVPEVAISVETTSNAMVEHQQLRELRQSWTSRDVSHSPAVSTDIA